MKTEFLLEREVRAVLMLLTPVNRLVVRVMLHTGLRVGDACALPARLAETGRCTITEAKTGKQRRVSVPAGLRDELRQFADEKWLFPSSRSESGHICRQGVWKDIKRAASALRLEQNVGAHSCRKVYAVKLYRKYGDLERVRRALHHGDVTTTAIYAMADKALEARRDSRGRAYKEVRE